MNLGIICIIGIVNPYLMIPAIFFAFVFYKTAVFYLSTSRSIKRLEGISMYISSIETIESKNNV